MLRAVNWGEKLGHVFGGHRGRILRILIIFLCALGVLVGIYRARSDRIQKEISVNSKQLKSVGHALPAASTTKWVIVGNPDSDDEHSTGKGSNYVCSVAWVAREAGWKTIIIGEKLECCRMPDCYPIHKSQFLRMSYRTASVLKHLMETGQHPQTYKEAIRNLAFIWAIHRGARYVFDAYVEEYQSAGISIPKFEEELNRQLHTLALDESLALVEERSRSRTSLFKNPYSHFGRPDVRLLPSGPGTGSGSNSHTFQHATYHQYTTFNLGHAHGHGHHNHNGLSSTNHKNHDFPTFRICEVRPPSIEKFLEIDEGWWDMRAPALVLPGDTMPPLCTRNTLFSPEVFWALPLLPDYTAGESYELPDVPQNSSRIPPWYIRGLWSQSLLGDLGGSIRLTLSRVPTLQLNQDYFAGGDYEPNLNPSSTNGTNRTGSSKLLKRWHCRSRSTFRCLSLMSKELSKSIYLKKDDLSLIDAWILDLRSIHYAEPPMLPRRRSHTNPCLGADGLHGVSFYPSLEPNSDFLLEDYVAKRNDTLKSIVAKFESESVKEPKVSRDKRETERPMELPLWQLPPNENSTYAPIDWSVHVPQIPYPEKEITVEQPPVNNAEDSYYLQYKESQAQMSTTENHPVETQTEDFVYHHHDMLSNPSTYSRRVLPIVDKPVVYPSATYSPVGQRTAKQFRAFLQEVAAKSADAIAGEFPILKAISENMCPGFAPLIPYQPKNVYKDALLIVVFTNQHYDLIPTLEVLYRSAFPNILYCGHPHESVEIFLRKYQTVEHRSFSFLPTYTRATYECVLGAMEMNYEVKGYMVVTDETLMKTWNIEGLDMNKIWVSSSGHDNRHVPVTKTSWPKLDPQGQKLPRLLDGIIATWKLFTYILVGQDSWTLEPRGIKKRSIDDDMTVPIAAEKAPLASSTKENHQSAETLVAEETAYIPRAVFSWSDGPNNHNNTSSSNTGNIDSVEEIRIPSQSEDKNSDLSVSDWDYIKGTSFAIPKGKMLENPSALSNETDSESTGDESVDEEVLVGDEDDVSTDAIENIPSLGTSPTPSDQITDENDSLILATPTDPTTQENSTSLWPAADVGGDPANNSTGASVANSDSSGSSTTTGPESSVGVPLYHVEHVEPPTAPTWHKPDDIHTASTERGGSLGKGAISETSNSGSFSFTPSEIPTHSKMENVSDSTNEEERNENTKESAKLHVSTSSPTTEKVGNQERLSSTSSESSPVPSPSTTDGSSGLNHADEMEQVLKREIDSLLDGLHQAYLSMLGVVAQYHESNDTVRNTEFSSEGGDASLLEDAKSHRISPREFRHIRCTLQDDGHQSELCSTLRQYINVLGMNIGRDIRLFHDTIPMYYLPSWTTKSFYSVANVLLHYGVMDELALPLLFRGLAYESDWINLNRSSDLTAQSTSSSSDDSSGESSRAEGQYLHPFNLHRVYSDHVVRYEFCSRYLLRVLQM